MRNTRLLALVGLIMVTLLASTALAGPDANSACNVCTCESGEIVCLDAFLDTLEEQAICGTACATVGSTHGSREFFDQPCDTLVQCGHVEAPVANGPWLAASALTLLGLGALALRRMKARNAA